MRKIEALLCDSDGTLVDTPLLIRHGQFEAAHTYLTNHGIPSDDLPDYPTYEALLHKVVGGRTRDTIESTVRLLYENQPHYLEDIDFDELYALLDPIQDRIAPEYVHGYPGLENFLSSLSEMGIKMAIFSSGDSRMIVRNLGIALPQVELGELYKAPAIPNQEKLRMFVNAVRETYKLPGFTVITSDHTTEHKPHPEGLQMCMEQLGVTASASAVLGDHVYDMTVGIRADVPIRIGITHGFDDEQTLRSAGATDIAHSLDEVSAILTV
jgi:phosphoglycolate phosphatase-like HAD superfamily hydrolase